jgi:hypothetical protein
VTVEGGQLPAVSRPGRDWHSWWRVLGGGRVVGLGRRAGSVCSALTRGPSTRGGDLRRDGPADGGSVTVDDNDARGVKALHRLQHLADPLERDGLVNDVAGDETAVLDHLEHGAVALSLHSERAVEA